MKIASNISFLFTKRLSKNAKNCKNGKKVGLRKKRKKTSARKLWTCTESIVVGAKSDLKRAKKILPSYSQVPQRSGTNLSSSEVGVFGTYKRISYSIYHHMLLF